MTLSSSDPLQQAWDAVLCRNWRAAVDAAERVRQVPGYLQSAACLELLTELAGQLPRGMFVGATQVHSLQVHLGPITSLALYDRGRRALTGSHDGTIRHWDLVQARCLGVWPQHDAPVVTVQVVRDGSVAFSLDCTGVQMVWDLQTGAVLSRKKTPATLLALSANGHYVLWGGPLGISVVEADSGRHMRTIETTCTALAISPDGRRAASATSEGHVHLWSTPTGRRITALTEQRAAVRALVFDPDGGHLLSGSDDNSIICYEIRQFLYAVRTLKGHTEAVSGLALSADGNALASATRNGPARIFDVRTGTCVRVLHGPGSLGEAVALSPSGRQMMVGDASGTLHWWVLDWRVQARDTAEWDDAARPCVDMFLASFRGNPHDISEAEQDVLLQELSDRGFGWLERHSVLEVLHQMAAERQRR